MVSPPRKMPRAMDEGCRFCEYSGCQDTTSSAEMGERQEAQTDRRLQLDSALGRPGGFELEIIYRHFGWQRGELEVLLAQVRNELLDPAIHAVFDL